MSRTNTEAIFGNLEWNAFVWSETGVPETGRSGGAGEGHGVGVCVCVCVCVCVGGDRRWSMGRDGDRERGVRERIGVMGGGGVEGGSKRSNERFVFIYEVHGINDS